MKWSNRLALRIIEERLLRNADYFAWSKKINKHHIIKIMKEVHDRAYDKTRCNNSCKDMYFCDLPKRHKGEHREDCGLFWY